MVCIECNNNCHSLNECNKYKEFNLIVENAHRMAQLRKHIKISAPHFKGRTEWFHAVELNRYEQIEFNDNSFDKVYRMLTITFDPRKFTLEQLTNPVKLINYGLNAIYDLKNLFEENIVLIVEYHKTGIPHFHLGYKTYDLLTHSTLKLRLRYYFSKDLRNRRAVHDRILNQYGPQYFKKQNTKYYRFKDFQSLSKDLIKL